MEQGKTGIGNWHTTQSVGRNREPILGKPDKKEATMARQILKDKDYDIISVIYNASQAVEICDQYVQDAKKEGDQEAQTFFGEVQQKNESLIMRGKDLLKSRLQ